MIKLWLQLAIYIIAFLVAYGQKTTVEAGFDAGFNVNSAGAPSGFSRVQKDLPGFTAAGHIKVLASAHFSLKAMVQYQRQAWDYRGLVFANDAGTGLAKGELNYKRSYLNIPLLAEYETGRRFKVNIGAGPLLGLLLGSQVKTTLHDLVPPNQTSVTKSSLPLRKIMYGITIAAGCQYPVSSRIYLNVDVSNNTGFTDPEKSPDQYKGKRMNYISFTTGLGFLL